MSYNVMLVPNLLVMERDQITRARLLARAKFLRSSDILCLQEVFQPKPTAILLDALTDTYPYSTPILGNKDDQDLWDDTWNRKIGRSSLKVISGGLTILSKWPIEHAAQYFYQHSCSAHTFVRVGFIYARILYGKDEHPIHVIGTHLQPNDHPGCYLSEEGEIREKQMKEIVGFLDARQIPTSELVFILGDFNIDRYNREQYERMLNILRVSPQHLHPVSMACSWDSSSNAMTHKRHRENQLLDYIFLRQDHAGNNSLWLNLIVDLLASEQWHLLGRDRIFSKTRNIPLMELSDHYPIVGFFNLSKHAWPDRSSGVLTTVQLVTVDTNLPVMLVDRHVRLGDSTDQNATLFLLTNNAGPRRHRYLKSEQYVMLIDAAESEYFLSDAKYLRMKSGIKHADRYLKIIQLNSTSKCIESNSTFILQSKSSKGIFYVNSNGAHLCSCTKEKDQAQQFRLIEVKRETATCTITHWTWKVFSFHFVSGPQHSVIIIH